MANSLAESKIGTIELTTEKIRAAVGADMDPSFVFDTNFLQQDIPMFA